MERSTTNDMTRLSMLIALAGVVLAPAEAQTPATPDDALTGSSLVLTEGIAGGIALPETRRRVLFAFDWNEGTFRAAEWNRQGDARTRVARISARDFREILDHVVVLGLVDLPLEEPRESEDIYGRNTGIDLYHAGKSWRNGAPGGCTHWPSRSQPDEDERRRFDDVLAYIDETLDALPMEPGTILDMQLAPMKSEAEARAFRAAVTHLRREPYGHEVDFNRIAFAREGGFEFAWREAQHGCLPMPPWPGSCIVTANPDRVRVVDVQHLDRTEESRARRQAFVDEHPELSPGDRRLILTGWVDTGMTEEMAVASWGPSERRRVLEDGTVYLRFASPAEHLRFEDGRLRHLPGLRRRLIDHPPGKNVLDRMIDRAQTRR